MILKLNYHELELNYHTTITVNGDNYIIKCAKLSPKNSKHHFPF